MSPIRVLLISHSYPPVLGGSEVEAQRVAALLRARGHEVHVLCAANPEMTWRGEGKDEYGTPVRVAGIGAGRVLDWSFAGAVAWEIFAGRNRYDLIYFLMQGVHLAAGLPVAQALGKPVVMKVSGSGLIPMMERSALGRLQLKWLNRWASTVMVLNEGMMEEARAAGIGEAKLSWMPNPVDCDEFRPVASEEARRGLRGRLGLDPEGRYVVFVGRLAPEKELGSLVDAMGRVKGGVELVLVGDGPERGGLERQVASGGVRARFVGRQPLERVREYLQAADVFALVSRLEGFPCSMVEAMACGLPVVASRIPANAQLVEEGKLGYLAGLRDAGEIAAGIERVLDSEEQGRLMGASAREMVESRYNYTSIAVRYEELFARALRKRG